VAIPVSMLSISRSRHLDLATRDPASRPPRRRPSGGVGFFFPTNAPREDELSLSVGLEFAEQAMQPTRCRLETALDLVECRVNVIGGDLSGDLDHPFHQEVD
jgi:hypothetical protein